MQQTFWWQARLRGANMQVYTKRTRLAAAHTNAARVATQALIPVRTRHTIYGHIYGLWLCTGDALA